MCASLDPELQSVREVLSGNSKHLTTILEGAVASFNETANPLSLQNTGTAIRELIREFLGCLSPDAEIVGSSWFVPDPSSKTGVTRRHRVQFAIYRYLDPRHFRSSLVDAVDTIADDLSSAISDLSALTHITAATIEPDRSTAISLFKRSLTLFVRLVSAIQDARRHLNDEIESALALSLAQLFVDDFFDDLDQLSTHTRPQDADGIEVEVAEITEDGIHFTGSGTVYCDMQFGSDGDCRRGDGVEWEESFPFTFVGVSSLEAPFDPQVNVRDITIDTSSYYDDHP